MPALEEAGAALRRTVVSGAADDALRSLAEYTRVLNAAPEDLRRALELLRWASRVARAQRAHTALELAQLTGRRRYMTGAAQPAATFQFRG